MSVPTPRAPSLPGSGLNATTLYASDAPGVVDITARSTTTTAAGPFGLPRKAQATDTGTGTVLDTQGRILTADRVVAVASSITVTLQNGDTRPAKLLGGDSATDTAVVKIDPSGMTLHPLPLGSLATLRIGGGYRRRSGRPMRGSSRGRARQAERSRCGAACGR